jgi:hypothetical protein
MRKSTFAIAAVLLVSVASSVHAAESGKEAKAAELLHVAKMDETLQQSVNLMKQQVKVGVRQQLASGAQTPEQQRRIEEFQQKITDLVSDTLAWSKLQPEYVALFADVYSEQELDGLIAFYTSPVGKAMVEKTPMLMQRSSQIAQKHMQDAQPELEKLLNEMQSAPAKPSQP